MPWPARPRAWLISLALLVALPGAAQAACGTMNVPDAYTTPTTSPMASGGSIVIDANRCDSFGLNPYPNPGTSAPSHGTVTVDTLAATITYTNNGDGATSDSFVVEDASNNPFTVNVAIAAATSPITVSPATLPTPNVGTPYSQQLSASGGTAPYGYAVTGGSLAPGLSLVGDTISGTPNQAGGYSVTITVTDDTGATADKSYTVNVPNPSSGITVANPPTADLSAPYSYDLNPNTSGALAPYTYALYSGTLPPGLSLSGGIISGTPTTVGTFNFAVDVRDSSPNLFGLSPGPYGKVVNLGITVQNVPPTTNPVSATVAYGSTNNPVILNITGSAATSVAVATAAAHGAAIAAGTAITYTPNPGYAGPDSFTYTATNAAGTSSPATVTITVSPPTIAYAPSSPAAATVGAAYSQSLASASGGAAPYTYALASGALPAGLSLASDGTVSGTPSAGGSFTFSVIATDSSTGTGPFSATSASLTLTVDAPTIVLSPASLPAASTGIAYSASFSATGGTPGYTYALTAGALPAGLTLASSGTLSGTPIAAGTYNFTVAATDSSGGSGPFTGSRAYLLQVASPLVAVISSGNVSCNGGSNGFATVSASGGVPPYTYSWSPSGGTGPNAFGLAAGTYTVTVTDSVLTTTTATVTLSQPPVLTITPDAIPAATVGVAYSQTLSALGGTDSKVFYTGGVLPSGLSLSPAGVISGTPTITGVFTLQVYAEDANACVAGKTYSLAIDSPTVVLSPASVPTGTVGSAYSQTITASGGSAPYTYSHTGGTLPNGLALASDGTLSGTPTAGGTYSFTITATDSNGFTGSQAYMLGIDAAAIALSPTTLAAARVGSAYSETLAASGGTAPYSYAVTAGALPAGLSLSATGALAGTPTEGGSFPFTVTATDSSGGSGPYTGSRAYTLTVAGATITLTPSSLPAANAGSVYSQSFGASGGTAPYSFAISAGALPAGLSLAGDGTLSGTPTASGTFTFTVTATDSSTGTGPYTAAQAYTLTIGAPTITLAPATLPAASVGTAFNVNLTASGGAGPYAFALSAGALPAGVTLAADGTLSGTPTAGGSFPVTITAIDALGFDGTQAYTLAVGSAAIVLTPATLPDGSAGTAYSQVLTASGGTAPYSFAISAGALPAGLSFASDGTLSGTPTASGSFTFSVTATDSSGGTGPYTATRGYTLTVAAPTITLTPATLPGATVASPYAQTLGAVGGTAPYTFAVTAGALPVGVTLAADGTLSGTPTAGGSFAVTITATDALGFSANHGYTLPVAAPVLAIGPATLPGATAGTAYAQQLTASGGTAPYTFAVSAGALPAGLSLAGDGTLSGTPTASGSFTFSVTATDSSGGTGPYTATRGYALTVAAPTITLTPTTLPGATVASPYAQTLGATGGTAPYTFAVTAGALPAGVTLAADGTLSGTPTAGGSFAVTITATDALGFSANHGYTLPVAAPVLAIGPATLPGATAGTAYAQQLTASGGTAPYTFAVSTGALPAGLSLAADGSLSGTPTASGTFAFTVTATDDSTGSGPYSTTRDYTLAVAADPPVVVPDSATALAGTAVDIAVTANDSGRIDSIALASTPQHGDATVDGLVVRYAPAAGFSGEDSFRYVATGPGGTSAPATITVTVHPVPVAVSRTLQAIAGVENRVDLAEGASGGPFTGATLVALAPANAGVATVAAEGGTWVLRFTPDTAFGGEATARFTLDNAHATSAEATITFQVQTRPDPTRDAQVRGLVDAQVETARRFAQAQLGNFRQRLEQLHGAGRRGGRFANGVTFAERQCAQATDRAAREECQHRRDTGQERVHGAGGPSDADVAQAGAGNGSGTTQAVFGVWAGGMIRSGSFDGRGGGGAGFESDGLSVGVDFDLGPSFTLGTGLGYGRDDNRIGDAGSRLEGSARAFVAYASYHPWQHLFVDGTLGYQQLDYDATRRLADDAGTVRGRRDGDQWFASLAVGADLQDGALQFTPYARIDVARGGLDAYTESGHPFLALRYGAMDIDSTVGNLGLRLDYRRRVEWGWFTPQLRLEYQREFADAEASLIRYADLANGPVYTLTPSVFDRNRVVFGLGATLDSDGGWSTRIEYQAQAGGQRDEGVQVNLQKDF